MCHGYYFSPHVGGVIVATILLVEEDNIEIHGYRVADYATQLEFVWPNDL